MEIPDTCRHCGAINLVDWLTLERRPLSKVLWVEGYQCKTCSSWKPVYYSNRQLDESLRKLEVMRPTHPSFLWHFAKTMKRSIEIQRRGLDMDGTLEHKNMVASG